jgi:hypothetical protein
MMSNKVKTTARKEEARPALEPRLRFPEFREAVTPELLAGLGVDAFQSRLNSPPLQKLTYRIFPLTTRKAALDLKRFITRIGKQVEE